MIIYNGQEEYNTHMEIKSGHINILLLEFCLFGTFCRSRSYRAFSLSHSLIVSREMEAMKKRLAKAMKSMGIAQNTRSFQGEGRVLGTRDDDQMQ